MTSKAPAVAAAVLVAAIAAGGAQAATSWKKPVQSWPGVHIPRVFTTVNDAAKSPGYMFLTPRARLGQKTGPTILDANGKVVWFHQLSRKRTSINLRPQTYRGKPVLTWGQRPPLGKEGDLYSGDPHDVYNVIADQSYRIIARVRARGRGLRTDLHEFQITRRNTALLLASRTIGKNLRRYGGPARGAVLDNVVQEIDIRTGRVLLSWSAARRLSPRGSYVKPPATGSWDPYHINSVSEDSDGNLLLTARHLSAVIKINRRNGRVRWKLGGRDSDFRVSSSARFYYPHDARRAADGTLTVFDNRATFLDKSHGPSRGIRVRVNTRKRTASLARAFAHPTRAIATSQGNATMLGNKNVFVGWGSSPWFSEHAADGRLVFAAHFQSQWNQSYRAYKAPWTAQPGGDPQVAARTRDGVTAVYVSWNGATEVAQWRVLSGAGEATLAPVVTGERQDFETRLAFPGTPVVVRVEALNAAGEVVGRSLPIKPKTS